MKTQVFLLKDILNVGMAGEIVGVADGFATNYVIPRKLGIIVTDKNKAELEARIRKVEKRIEVVKSKTSMLAERIKSAHVVVKTKIHPDGKLYGAVRPQDIVEQLAEQGVAISKNMIIFDKHIKEKGTHEVTIKLSTTLQPRLTVKVVPE